MKTEGNQENQAKNGGFFSSPQSGMSKMTKSCQNMAKNGQKRREYGIRREYGRI
jgi:hypothetical protein